MTVLLKLFLVAVILVAGAALRRHIARHGFPLLWRWLSGIPCDGSTPGGSRFWARPRWQRSALRTGATLAGIAAAWGLLFHRRVTLLVIVLCAVAGITYGATVLARWARSLRHQRVWVQPAHLVAAPLVGLPKSADPGWLTVDPDRSRVVAELPAAYNPDDKQRQRLVQTLEAKLGLDNHEARWALAGPKPRLELTRSVPPPSLVTLADALPAIEASKPDELVWGLGAKRKVVKTSLSGDSPHFGLSMGSGAGKSVTARALLAQGLHKGGIGMILDNKMISHPWAQELPNVVIYREPHEIHAALLWARREMNRRNKVALAGVDEDGNIHADVGPRVFVIAEELNATMDAVRDWWSEEREKGDPARPPSVTAFNALSFMGRQVRFHIGYIGQALSARAMGGGRDSTENMGVIAFSRTKPRTWKMLAPEFPQPPKDNHIGRLHVVSDRVEAVQGILMTPAEAKAFAVSGTVSPLPYGMPGARATAETAHRDIQVTALELRKEPVSAAPVSEPVTLRQAVGAGLLGDLKLAGVRTARHRDETFPRRVARDGVAELYDPAALAAWASQRKE